MDLDELNQNIEFTRCVIEEGNSDKQVKDNQWFIARIKTLFNQNVIIHNKYSSHDIETLLGFKPAQNQDDYVEVKMRLGFYKSQISKIIHRAINQMYLNDKIQISFELNPILLDESLKHRKSYTNSDKQDVFLDLSFEITLIEMIENDESNKINTKIYEMNNHDLFELANEHKSEANQLYLKNMIHTAFDRYHKSISCVIIAQHLIKDRQALQTIKEENEDDESQENDQDLSNKLKILKSQLYSNLSACQLKSFNYKMAILNCNKCLDLDSNNVKALFRRAQSYMYMNEFEKSLDDMNIALKFDPDNKEIKQKIIQVENLMKEYNHKMASRLKNLFK